MTTFYQSNNVTAQIEFFGIFFLEKLFYDFK